MFRRLALIRQAEGMRGRLVAALDRGLEHLGNTRAWVAQRANRSEESCRVEVLKPGEHLRLLPQRNPPPLST